MKVHVNINQSFYLNRMNSEVRATESVRRHICW